MLEEAKERRLRADESLCLYESGHTAEAKEVIDTLKREPPEVQSVGIGVL